MENCPGLDMAAGAEADRQDWLAGETLLHSANMLNVLAVTEVSVHHAMLFTFFCG